MRSCWACWAVGVPLGWLLGEDGVTLGVVGVVTPGTVGVVTPGSVGVGTLGVVTPGTFGVGTVGVFGNGDPAVPDPEPAPAPELPADPDALAGRLALTALGGDIVRTPGGQAGARVCGPC